ncbi:MAG TPA: type II toxin-antitoxin system prevent-host-death family antitoxin [Acidobacteriaceae bacterium]|jgi:prevent-host-death family protein
MVMKATAKTETRTIAAGEFKAKCLQLMDEVKTKKLHLIVTKRGEPVMEIGPPAEKEKPFRSVVGRSARINVPSAADWKRLKTELAAEWDEPADKLARMAHGHADSRKRRA